MRSPAGIDRRTPLTSTPPWPPSSCPRTHPASQTISQVCALVNLHAFALQRPKRDPTPRAPASPPIGGRAVPAEPRPRIAWATPLTQRGGAPSTDPKRLRKSTEKKARPAGREAPTARCRPKTESRPPTKVRDRNHDTIEAPLPRELGQPVRAGRPHSWVLPPSPAPTPSSASQRIAHKPLNEKALQKRNALPSIISTSLAAVATERFGGCVRRRAATPKRDPQELLHGTPPNQTPPRTNASHAEEGVSNEGEGEDLGEHEDARRHPPGAEQRAAAALRAAEQAPQGGGELKGHPQDLAEVVGLLVRPQAEDVIVDNPRLTLKVHRGVARQRRCHQPVHRGRCENNGQ